jgi:predicted polyphosphate/ATP-dependent NAD kinase
MRKFLRRWLGIEDHSGDFHGIHQDFRGIRRVLVEQGVRISAIDEQLAELIAQRQRELLAPSEPVEAESDQAPGVVDEVVNYWWKESPQAAATTRTYARAMLALGASPDTVARRIMESGVTIE